MGLKILMMMRPNARTQRGGDTVVLDRLTDELIKLGHEVTIDLDGEQDPAQYDITHLYNFATEKVTEKLARKCVERGAKYVVTTLYEDWPLFFNQMILQELILSGYVKYGQPREYWERFRHAGEQINKADIQDNTFTATNAQILISSGYNESVSLRRDFPDAGEIEICKFGSEITEFTDGGELFRKQNRMHDEYILCVGRLEQRKNQLGLLKALEDSDLNIVFAAGGFTYEPMYEAACRKFHRKGRSLFLGRVPADVLTSAYDGAKAHVLPSWYELPGLVSLEAAARGLPVVATEYGTIRDYLGDDAFYCDPGNPDDIAIVVEKALATPVSPELKKRAAQYTWAETARRSVELYERAIALPLRHSTRETGNAIERVRSAESIPDSDLHKYPVKQPLIIERLKPRV